MNATMSEHDHDWQPAADFEEIALCECGDYRTLKEATLEEKIYRIRELHKPTIAAFPICHECNRALLMSNADAFILYPCPTIKALEGEK